MDSAMSFYHRYRPQQFSHLVGQEHVSRILQEALRSDRLAHAYLFCGTRGTGKTTTARLLAKAVNCGQLTKKDMEPCNACDLCQAIASDSCLDVVEIDAASNRGIEEIRQLQDQIRFRPQLAARKVVIIDEVHMLTKEAFNALLKTLEEPPSYLLFVLATTEPHKLPATVISRCQRFDFMTPGTTAISQYLSRIAEAEKLKIEEPALTRLAELAHGSFRDSSTILEQLATSGQSITLELVVTNLGLPAEELLDRYLAALGGQDDSSLVADLQHYFNRGGNPAAFIDAACYRLESQLVAGQAMAASRVLSRLARMKYQLRYVPSGQLPILAALSDETPVVSNAGSVPSKNTENTALTGNVSANKTALPPVPPVTISVPVAQKVEVAAAAPSPEPAKPPVIMGEPSSDTETVTVQVAEQVPPAELPEGSLTDRWQLALEKLITDSQSSMVAILRTAKPLGWQPPVLRIGVQFPFHADQLGRTKNRGILEAVMSDCLGSPVRVELEVLPANDLASAVSEIDI